MDVGIAYPRWWWWREDLSGHKNWRAHREFSTHPSCIQHEGDLNLHEAPSTTYLFFQKLSRLSTEKISPYYWACVEEYSGDWLILPYKGPVVQKVARVRCVWLCKLNYIEIWKHNWIFSSSGVLHRPLTRYAKSRVAHAPGMPRTFSPPLQRKPLVNDPGMHTRAMMHVGTAKPRWRGKRSRYYRRMRNPRYCVSGNGPMHHYQNNSQLCVSKDITEDLNWIKHRPNIINLCWACNMFHDILNRILLQSYE